MRNLLILLILLPLSVSAQNLTGTIDTVFQFTPGTGQSGGQTGEYFPENIFGPPTFKAGPDSPVNTPYEILSIGKGGEIIVGFKGRALIDLEGPDFTIFENAFENAATGGIFAEPAKIAVSKDGIDYVEFPFDSATLEGLAGITPTIGNADPFNPESSGGDSFDLSELGLDSVRFIKITDISDIISTLPKDHKFYNPEFLITGFDLDAVAGIHLTAVETSIIEFSAENDIPNGNYDIYDLNARRYRSVDFSQNPGNNLRHGLYIGIENTKQKKPGIIKFIVR
jgi:hypothetical protein